MTDKEREPMTEEEAKWLMWVCKIAIKERFNYSSSLQEEFLSETILYLLERWDKQPALRQAVKNKNLRTAIVACRQAAEKRSDKILEDSRKSILSLSHSSIHAEKIESNLSFRGNIGFEPWTFDDFLKYGKLIELQDEEINEQDRTKASLFRAAIISARGSGKKYVEELIKAEGVIKVAAEACGLPANKFRENLTRLLKRMNKYSSIPVFLTGKD